MYKYFEKITTFPTDSMYKFVVFVGIFITAMTGVFTYNIAREMANVIYKGYPTNEWIQSKSSYYEELLELMKSGPGAYGISNLDLDALERNVDELNKAIVENNALALEQEFLRMQWRVLTYAAPVGMFVGLLTTFVGFYYWHNRLQKYQDKIFKKLSKEN